METFFGKRSLLINIKIKAVMNKNIFYAIFRFISLNHFQAKFFLFKIFFWLFMFIKNSSLHLWYSLVYSVHTLLCSTGPPVILIPSLPRRVGDDGGLGRLAVQVHHAVHLAGHPSGRSALVHAIDGEVKVAVAMAHHTNSVTHLKSRR